VTAAQRLAVCLTSGLVVAVLVAEVLGATEYAPLTGWDAAAALFSGWLGSIILRAEQRDTARLAAVEDSSRAASDLVLLCASVASLFGVGVLLVQGKAQGGPGSTLAISVSIATLVLSWSVVHLIFTTRYARLYYAAPRGGINFHSDELPRYLDFAYVAFTVGMTFQVSDTDLQDQEIRAVALRHALLSYLFGAVILATTINLIAGLSK
jgi:uncharacterized membrane protein